MTNPQEKLKASGELKERIKDLCEAIARLGEREGTLSEKEESFLSQMEVDLAELMAKKKKNQSPK